MKETCMMNTISVIKDNLQKDNLKLSAILMKKITLAIFFGIMFFYAKSQSTTILEQGIDGFGSNIGVMRGSNYQGPLYILGITYKGILDLNASYNKKNFDTPDEVLIGTDAKSISKALSISYWFLRSDLSDNINIKLGVTSGIEFSTYDNYKYIRSQYSHLLQLENSTKGNIGIGTVINIAMEKNWKIQPNLSYSYLLGTEEILDLNKETSDSYDSFKTSFGLIFGKQFGGDTHVFISVNQVFFTNINENYCLLAAGLAFTIGK